MAMRDFMPTKLPNQVDTKEIKDVKGFIRKTEAISGARYAGLQDDHISTSWHFRFMKQVR